VCGKEKTKKSPCNSMFKHGIIRPTVTSRKRVLACANRPDFGHPMILTVRMGSHI
jgi:hypothetical protein